MSIKIKNISQLQEFVLSSLEDLANKKIDVNEMGIIAKSSETIMSSLKLQLAYNSMRGETPHIKFLQDCNEGFFLEKTPEIKKIGNNND